MQFAHTAISARLHLICFRRDDIIIISGEAEIERGQSNERDGHMDLGSCDLRLQGIFQEYEEPRHE